MNAGAQLSFPFLFSPSVGVDLPTAISLTQRVPHSHALRFAYEVILDPVK